jgi:hypothetical protein
VLSHRDLDAAIKRLEDNGAKPRVADAETAAARGHQLGKIFHHTPRLLQPARDLVFDRSTARR